MDTVNSPQGSSRRDLPWVEPAVGPFTGAAPDAVPEPGTGRARPTGPALPAWSPPEPPALTGADRGWAVAAHLSAYAAAVVLMAFVGPLVVYLAKKDTSPFAREHAANALNFWIWWYLSGAVVGVLAAGSLFFGMVTGTGWALALGALLIVAYALGALLLPVWGASRALAGHRFRYPLTPRIVR